MSNSVLTLAAMVWSQQQQQPQQIQKEEEPDINTIPGLNLFQLNVKSYGINLN